MFLWRTESLTKIILQLSSSPLLICSSECVQKVLKEQCRLDHNAEGAVWSGSALFSQTCLPILKDPKFSDRQAWANSLDPDETSWRDYTVFALFYGTTFRIITAIFLVSRILGFLRYLGIWTTIKLVKDMKESTAAFYIMKVLTIGDSAVGKSSLMYRYTEDSFSGTYINTVGQFWILIYIYSYMC